MRELRLMRELCMRVSHALLAVTLWWMRSSNVAAEGVISRKPKPRRKP